MATTVNLQKAYSKLNSSIVELFDGLGIHRAATIPHVDGQTMADHIQAIGQVLPTIGGVTANFLTATHTKHDPKGGSTVAHSADTLRSTIIPKDNEQAHAAVMAAKAFASDAASLLGDDDPTVKVAKGQLDLFGKNDMAGMSAFDAGAALLSVPGPLIQSIARAHSGTKAGGHSPQLRAPGGSAPAESASNAPGQSEEVGDQAEGQEQAAGAPAAQETAPAAASQAGSAPETA